MRKEQLTAASASGFLATFRLDSILIKVVTESPGGHELKLLIEGPNCHPLDGHEFRANTKDASVLQVTPHNGGEFTFEHPVYMITLEGEVPDGNNTTFFTRLFANGWELVPGLKPEETLEKYPGLAQAIREIPQETDVGFFKAIEDKGPAWLLPFRDHLAVHVD